MAVDIFKLIDKFEPKNDVESRVAYFRTHVPWIGSEAYLNIVFKPLAEQELIAAAHRIDLPEPLIDFYRIYNGAILLAGSIAVYGIHPPGMLLNRENVFETPPFNIEWEDDSHHPGNRERYLGFGGYSWDGSTACIDRQTLQVRLFRRGRGTTLRETEHVWSGFDEWLSAELRRLTSMFDSHGKRLVDGAMTVPEFERAL